MKIWTSKDKFSLLLINFVPQHFNVVPNYNLFSPIHRIKPLKKFVARSNIPYFWGKGIFKRGREIIFKNIYTPTSLLV